MTAELPVTAPDHEARIPLRAYVVVLCHIVAVLMLAAWALGNALPHDNSATLTAVDSAAVEPGQPATLEPVDRDGGEAPAPTGVQMPTVDIGVDTVPVGTENDGSLQVPDDPHISGWWNGGAAPGEPGAAVIVGHVDSREGPGAFFRLGDLDAGESVTVDRADGTSVGFRVDRIERHPKDDFPTGAVYDQTRHPTLRLITCSGEFDRRERSYEENTIVFLEMETAAPEVADRPARRPAPARAEASARAVPAPQGNPGPAGGEGPPDAGIPIAAALLSLVGTTSGVVRQRQVSRRLHGRGWLTSQTPRPR